MRNAFSIQLDANDECDRLWVVIDGERRFQLSSECLADSIFSTDGASDWLLKAHQKSESERVVDYGFCVEDCCPSKFATVEVNAETVTWTSIRESTSDKPLNAEAFEFDRRQYEAEIRRALIALVKHYAKLYINLRWPTPAHLQGEATVTNQSAVVTDAKFKEFPSEPCPPHV